MNWVDRMYEIKGKDLYSQNGEGLLLEYIWHSIKDCCHYPVIFDIGCGDRFILSNSRHLQLNNKFKVLGWDIDNKVTLENCTSSTADYPAIISIDIDGNDYWILEKQLPFYEPAIIVAEYNPAFTDSRTIKYNPNHVWAGDDYYGFSFNAGVKLAEENGYTVIFANEMNMFMVRKDLVKCEVRGVVPAQNNFFKKSERTDWVMI